MSTRNKTKSLEGKKSSKSDVEVKEAFCKKLKRNGYEDIKVSASPADITAKMKNRTCYFEIKFTNVKKMYFGAATLTEWKAAIDDDNEYSFVIAKKIQNRWKFTEYSPDELMEFSTIPPFKTFFNIPVDNGKARPIKKKKKTKAIKLTKPLLVKMIKFHSDLRLNS